MDVMGGLSDVFVERGDDFQFLASGARLNRLTLNLATDEASKRPVDGAIAGEFPAWQRSSWQLLRRDICLAANVQLPQVHASGLG
jgi:hypothetical protein